MQQVVTNAKTLAEALVDRGYPLVSGGPDNHLILMETKDIGMTGKEAEELLDNLGVTTNKNGIPFDTEKPTVTSGLRIGTPAVTTRGMGEAEMVEIADIMKLALIDKDAEAAARLVKDLTDRFPLYV